MLISNPHRFIYLKTVKTAGTSIEIYFEPFCLSAEDYDGPRHQREAEVTRGGVVGYRGPERPGEAWYNHMPAAAVRERVGEEVWSGYYKFCSIRNPFDKVVSYFWFSLPRETGLRLRSAPFSEVRTAFAHWAAGRNFPLDRHIYTIEGELAVDAIVRYEHLETDMAAICAELKIPWVAARMGRYKSDFRLRTEHFCDYYDSRAKELVGEAYAWELDYFRYPPP